MERVNFELEFWLTYILFYSLLICNTVDIWALILKLFHQWDMGKRTSFLKKSSQFYGTVGFPPISFISFH